MGLFKKTDLRCQAYVKTTLNYGDPEFVSDHCHPSNETEVNITKFRLGLRKRPKTQEKNQCRL